MRAITIGKLAAAAGANLETVRYYERIGLMPEPGRAANGYRRYGGEHLSRLKFVRRFVRRARELGFSIEEIRTLLDLAAPSNRACAEVRDLTLAHLADVQAKIADLRRLEDVLRTTVAECSGARTPVCPVLSMLDEA